MLNVTALSFGLMGTFYLSAQAIGFNNLRTIQERLSDIVGNIIAVQYIVADRGTNNNGSQVRQLSTVEVLWGRISQRLNSLASNFNFKDIILAYYCTVLLIVFVTVNVGIIHGILGLLLAFGWILYAFKVGIAIPIWAKVLIALTFYAAGSNLLGERPHNALTKASKLLVNVLKKHFEWVATNTKEGGKTGIVGFTLVAVSLFCQFLLDL